MTASGGTVRYGDPLARYQRVLVETAEPGQLVVLALRETVTALRRGLRALEAGEREHAHQALLRAQDLVWALIEALDRTASIADPLLALYRYCLERLVAATVGQDAAAARAAEAVLAALLEAFSAASSAA